MDFISSVLCVGAHPDDIELMAGGSVARWIKEGRQGHFLTFTDGAWISPSGRVEREAEEALREGSAAASSLGVEVENLQLPSLDLRHEDRLVMEVLRRVEHHKIDTIVCPWDGDSNHDHEVVSRICVSASRRVPRVMMGAINFFLREFFTPNFFVDISDTWDDKISAMECYDGQWSSKQKCDEWLPWLDESSRLYGRMVGVPRAEGFIVKKFLLD